VVVEEKVVEEKVEEKVVDDEEEEEEDCEVCEYNGKKYVKTASGIIYDYEAFVNDEEQIVVGKWMDALNGIMFNKDLEDSDEESDSSDSDEE